MQPFSPLSGQQQTVCPAQPPAGCRGWWLMPWKQRGDTHTQRSPVLPSAPTPQRCTPKPDTAPRPLHLALCSQTQRYPIPFLKESPSSAPQQPHKRCLLEPLPLAYTRYSPAPASRGIMYNHPSVCSHFSHERPLQCFLPDTSLLSRSRFPGHAAAAASSPAQSSLLPQELRELHCLCT